MNKQTLYPIFLRIWAGYELVNALLSTVFLEQGAKIYGFSEWLVNQNIRYVFYQYGVLLFAIALFYYIASKDAVKYGIASLVIIGELSIGAVFTMYAWYSGAIDGSQTALSLSIALIVCAIAWILKPPSAENKLMPPKGRELQFKLLQVILWGWVGFEIANGIFSSILLEIGTTIYGTTSWLEDSRIIYAFHLYAVAIFTLALIYISILTDLARFDQLLFVYGMEQIATMFLSVYFAAEKQITTSLFWTVLLLQLLSIIVIILLQPSRKRQPPKDVPSLN